MRTFLSGLFARLGPPIDGDPGDDTLLLKFVSSRDEDAFQQIVRRHGPMVQGVCRRVLRNEADADDAFQAVFLVLVRKAATVRPGNMLGNWLYGVAVNVARKGREVLARRRTTELVGDVAQAEDHANRELRDAIDLELTQLPASYRAAVVACDLEGRTRKEAASQLGWSEGTVASRLARARAILADRLTRRGVVMPSVGLSAALGIGSPAVAALPRVVLVGHSELVTELAGEAMRAMSISKIKMVVAAVAATMGIVAGGAGVVWACGGYGPRLIATPVSAAKPYPFQSIESRSEDDGERSWMKPMSGEVVVVEKPASENGGGLAKPARFVLRNPERDITIFTDRDETFVEFFRRQKLMVAGLSQMELSNVLKAHVPTQQMFSAGASHNESGINSALYGAFLRIAPRVKPVDDYLAQFIEMLGPGAAYLVLRHEKDDLWEVVGYTTRTTGVAFFTMTEKKGRDPFAPAELIHTPKQ